MRMFTVRHYANSNVHYGVIKADSAASAWEWAFNCWGIGSISVSTQEG